MVFSVEWSLAAVIISSLKAVVETPWVTRSFIRCSPDIFTSSELDYGLFWPKLESMLVGTVERQTETVLVSFIFVSVEFERSLLYYGMKGKWPCLSMESVGFEEIDKR